MWGPTMWAKWGCVCVCHCSEECDVCVVCSCGVCVCCYSEGCDVCMHVTVQRALMCTCRSLFRGLYIHVYDLGSCDMCVFWGM